MRFRVLGPLQATIDGTPVHIGSPKQRRLLATLLVHAGTVTSTDALIAALWGDDPPSTALDSLRTYVYRLRVALDDGGALIVTRPPGYLLDVDAADVDAGTFERLLSDARDADRDPRARLGRLDEALGLWRGPAYAEFADVAFARAEAFRLEELRLTAIEDRVDVRLALDGHVDVIGELEAFVDRHPLRERARGQLMLALYRCGRQADALAHYRAFRSLLDEELGLEPSPELRALEHDVLRRSPTLTRPTASPEAVGSGPSVAAHQPPGAHATLPAEPTSLVGRDRDVAELWHALVEAPLVTVTGVGGVGKTRLALRVARQMAGDHADGTWWCELAPVAGAAEVVDAVATTLGIRPTEDGGVAASIVAFLRDRDALLVLDNCEHVAPGVAALVRDLLTACPDTTVLTTSRAPLGVGGERVHRLAPLPVDADASGRDGAALELFVARSRALRPDLDVDGAEHTRMVEICQRLDGLPLAIELAASRLRSLNPTDLADRLDHRFDLLGDRRQEAPGRHQGLRAVLDWSYKLLGAVERRLFARLAVFAGPFSLEAAEQVASGDGVAADEILDLLTGLVDHSLVSVLPGGGATRYALLETLRAYGLERLHEAGEEEELRRRHATYHVSLAEDADTQIRGRDEALGVARLDRAVDNLRAAHRWSVEHGEVDLALRQAAALFRYALWRLRAEMLGWAETAANLPEAAAHAAFPTVAGMAGWGAGLRGDLDTAERWAQRGLDALEDTDDPRALPALEVRMHTSLWQGELDACLEAAERGRALTQDPYELVAHYVPGLALTYAGRPEEALTRTEVVQAAADRHGNPSMRALVRYTRGEALLEIDPPRAIRPLEEASGLAASVDNRVTLGVVDVSLVSVHARHGEPRDALPTYTTVIDRLHAGGDWTHLWIGLRGLVSLLARAGMAEDAGVLLGAVRNADNAPPVYGEDAQRLAAVEKQLRARLGADELARSQARGRTMTDGAAIRFARDAIERATPATPAGTGSVAGSG